MGEHRYHRVSPKFWTTAQSEGWSEDTRTLALYILTGPHRTTEGLFRLPISYISEDLDWSPQRLREPFGELLCMGFIDYHEPSRWLLIVNALKWQTIENDNQAKGAAKRLAECPESPLTSTFKRLAEQYAERLLKQLPEGFGQRYGNPQALTQAQAQAPTDPTNVDVGVSRAPVDNFGDGPFGDWSAA